MKLTGVLNLICAIFITVILVLPNPANAIMKLKLGVVTRPGSAQNIVAEKFADIIETASGREIQVCIYHSACLGNETEILQQVQMNEIQMAVVTGGSFETFAPVTQVINYPFLFKDHGQADRILDGPLGQEILDSLDASGFKGLAFSENGFRNLTTNRHPVHTPKDIEGLKIRVMASSLHKKIWKAMGAIPVPIPWPIYSELEHRIVDGQENPLWVVEVYRFYQIQTHLTLTRHVYSFHIDVASLKWWDTLSLEHQNLIRSAVRQAARYQRQSNRSRNRERLKFLEEKGMIIDDQPDIAAFRRKVASVRKIDLFTRPDVSPMLEKIQDALRQAKD